MTNEYGERLDRNGYAPSLLNCGNGCWFCATEHGIERHELFGGALRDKSKKYGLWANLCAVHHRTGKDAVHQSEKAARQIRSIGQKLAMAYYGWDMDEWMQRFYKNHLEEMNV